MKIPPEVSLLRSSSRDVVRELGFLNERHGGSEITHAQCHALLELEHHGVLTAGELAARLRIDKSTASRTVSRLLERGLVRHRPEGVDRRRKPLMLAARGKRQLERINELANQQVGEALNLLTPEDRNAAVQGMLVYARALARRRQQQAFTVRPIERDDNPAVAVIIRKGMTELGACGPGFAIHDPEVDAMWQAYRSASSEYHVIEHRGRLVGGAGFAPLQDGARSVCELQKMYLLPEARGLGLGARLLTLCLAAAAGCGFRTCYLETLTTMEKARRLYTAFGFAPLDAPLGHTGHGGCDRWYALEL